MKLCARSLALVLAVSLFLSFWACDKPAEEVPHQHEKFSQDLLRSLNQAVSPLTGAEPTLPDDELAPLADLGQASVVGLGEATHGTHEFFAMKHRLFRYLVEHFDFRVFAFECDYAESIYLHRWLAGGAGDLDGLMRQKMHFWTWKTLEVKALLEWMRGVNMVRPEADRLHYVGVDCQFATYQPDLLREYLGRVSPRHLAEVEPLLRREESFRDAEFKNLTTEQYQTLQLDLGAEYQAWDDLQDTFMPRSSPREFEVMRQLVRSLSQVNQVCFESTTMNNYRDQFMADNTLWVRQNYGSGRGVALWAHNGHVANDFSDSVHASLGYHLRRSLGEKYVIVGFSFCQGSFNAVGYDTIHKVFTGLQTHTITDAPLDYSVNDLFHSAGRKIFLLRLDRLIEGDPLRAWFDQGRQMLSIGAAYDGNPVDYYGSQFFIRRHYDVLIHFDQTVFAPQI